MVDDLPAKEDILTELYIQYGDSLFGQYLDIIKAKFPELREYLERMRLIILIEGHKQVLINGKPYYPYEEEEQDLGERTFEAIPYIVRSINYLTPYLEGRSSRILSVGIREGLEAFIMKKMGYRNATSIEIENKSINHSFKEGSLDLLYMYRSIEHLNDPKRVLREILGLLKPGGLLFIIAPIIKKDESSQVDSLRGWFDEGLLTLKEYSIKSGHNLLPEVWMISQKGSDGRKDVIYSPEMNQTVSSHRYWFIEYLKEESKLCQGKVLDVGAGGWTLPWQLFRHCEYTSFDIEANPNIDIVGDVENMDMFSDSSFDVVICSEVLEHVASPERAVGEIYRVLKPGGKLLLTVPFDVSLHNCPADYWRFTEHGLRLLLGRFSKVKIKVHGNSLKPLGYSCTCIK